jgi:hypothetical protein
MGVVTDYIVKLVQKNLDEYCIVIWYDPKEHYSSLINKFQSIVTVLEYQGSYIQIRYELEPYLDSKEMKKVLVYIPQEQDELASPVIEAEYYGTVIKPSGPTGKNTKLEIIARNALANLFDSEEIANFEKSIQQGTLTLDDLDKLSESREETGRAGSLSLIFETADPLEIVLQFISDKSYDKKIEEKNAFNEFYKLISIYSGFESNSKDIEDYRQNLSRYIFISDFLLKVKDSENIPELKKIPRCHKKGHIGFCKKIISEWQKRRDLQELYVQFAEAIEKAFDLDSLSIPIEENIKVDTFPFFETKASTCAINLVINEHYDKALSIAQDRKNLFWTEIDYHNIRLLWNIITIAANINNLITNSNEQLKVSKYTPKNLVKNYTDVLQKDAWYQIDLLQRHLEREYSDYDDPMCYKESPMFSMIAKTRNSHSKIINDLAEAYSDSLVRSNFEISGYLLQREIYSKILKPYVNQGKTAYFMVDALRFEMGVDLYKSLEFDTKKIQAVIATPPTITPVGMASLLPEADKSFQITVTGSHDINVKIDDSTLKNREDRVKYLTDKTGQSAVFIKLDETQKITKAIEKKIKNSGLIVVTTQEIDDYSTNKDNKELTRQIMSLVLGQIKRSIRNLSQLGVKNFVITADHGHLFGEDLGSELRINSPGVEIYSDRRCWMGKGGESNPSIIRVKPEVFGIKGDFDFAPALKLKETLRFYMVGYLSKNRSSRLLKLSQQNKSIRAHKKA